MATIGISNHILNRINQNMQKAKFTNNIMGKNSPKSVRLVLLIGDRNLEHAPKIDRKAITKVKKTAK